MDKAKTIEIIASGRKMLKPDWDQYKAILNMADGNNGLPPLPIEKPFDKTAEFIDLIPLSEIKCGDRPISKVIYNRKSTREYSETPLTLDELSYLLLMTQGMKDYNSEWGWMTTVIPSAGMTHCLETYIYISRVEGLKKGIYRYLAVEHKLMEVNMSANVAENLNRAMWGQLFDASVVFLWTAFPYKLEYGYLTVAHKMVALEAGHVCQNLYLAAESIDCGCCAVSAYSQNAVDEIVGADGDEEFVIYTATVGKYPPFL